MTYIIKCKCGGKIWLNGADDEPRRLNGEVVCDDCYFRALGDMMEAHPPGIHQNPFVSDSLLAYCEAWWNDHCPSAWTKDQHLDNPDVNIPDENGRALARYIAHLIKRRGIYEKEKKQPET